MSSNAHQQPDVVVIGAGIVGVCTALALQERGLEVVILDRRGIGLEASFGNAGAFAFAEIEPLASPGVLREAPRWLLDPLGPLSIRPRYALRIMTWLFHFWRASRADHFAKGVAAQAALMGLSRERLGPLMERTGTQDMLRRDGNLDVYESQREFEAAMPKWEERARFGIEFQHLHGRDAIAEFQSGLSRNFVAATYTPGWWSISDPARYTQRLANAFCEHGGRFEVSEVVALSPQQHGAALHLADGRTVQAGQVVVCAGAWSHHLARTLGDRIPLEAERGYNTTLPPDAFDLYRQITFPAHGFVVSHVSSGIRVGGAVELGGLSLPPDFRRAQRMLTKAKKFLPELRIEGGRKWMGFRPSLPDSLPVIDRSPTCARFVYAFGHGHLGLTQASGTATLVADLVSGAEPAIDLHAFRAHRFAE